MSYNHLAFIFPAFPSDYTDHPGRKIPGFDVRFAEFLNKAALSVDPDLAGFSFTEKPFLGDELLTQYITYIYGCTASSLLRQGHLFPLMTAGYSMGIYAALFDSGSITFETGLTLIKIAYRCLYTSLKGRSFGMGALIGLDGNDIQQIIEQSCLRVEITNQNAAHSFVVSGYHTDVQKLMALAKKEGALHTRDLAVSIPYHSSYLNDGAMDFANQISHLKIRVPETPIISLIDQIALSTQEIIRQELIRNLFQHLNWLQTMQLMRANKVSKFIECGPSTGLARNAAFVEGIRFSPLSSILPAPGEGF